MVACSRPEEIVLLERLVREGPDLFEVANGGYSTYVLAGVLQDELGGGPADPSCYLRPDAEVPVMRRARRRHFAWRH